MKRSTLLIACCSLMMFLSVSPVQANTDKDSYIQKSEAEVREWGDKIKSLQNRSEKNGAKTRQELDHQLKALNEQLSLARKKLEALRGSSAGSWDHFRQGLEETLGDVKKKYRNATAYFNTNDKKEKP